MMAGAGALAVVSTLAACGRNQVEPDEDGRVRLRLALDGPARPEHGGYYQALASGGYGRRGLNVEIVPGAPGVDVPQQLAAGSVELGLGTDGFTALRLVAEGAPVRAVAAFFQSDPQGLIAHADPALEAIGDLAGRPFLIPPSALAGAWAWLKARHGFTDAQLAPYMPLPQAYVRQEQAVGLGYAASDPLRLPGDAPPARVFSLADEGYGAYAGLVLAPDGFARDNAAALRAFIAASAEGWRDYIRGAADSAGVRAAHAAIARTGGGWTPAILGRAQAALAAEGRIDGGDAALYGLGAMTAERWRAFFDAVAPIGLYPSSLDWRRAFTNQYLPGRG